MTHNTTVKECQNEGQRLLLASGKSLNQIAIAVGVTPPAAAHWAHGRRVPKGEAARKLQELYGVPPDAWNRPPASGAAAPGQAPRGAGRPRKEPDAPLRDVPPMPPVSADDPLAACRALMERASAGIALQGLSPSEAKSWQDQLLAAIKMAQHLQHAEAIREDTIARTPAYRAMVTRILNTLEEYPDALEAVVQVLGVNAPR
jgi:transcriptional regulator with XRE-family HTH domain